jgi:hypothetical protein
VALAAQFLQELLVTIPFYQRLHPLAAEAAAVLTQLQVGTA